MLGSDGNEFKFQHGALLQALFSLDEFVKALLAGLQLLLQIGVVQLELFDLAGLGHEVTHTGCARVGDLLHAHVVAGDLDLQLGAEIVQGLAGLLVRHDRNE